MCTLAFYFGVFEHYPLLVAANRDERYDRPSAPPHLWDIQPAIFAGKDLSAGGTWLGVNEHGCLAGILNRRSIGTPAPRLNDRSRGLLCLDLLRLKRAAEAHSFLQEHRLSYPPFTLLFADSKEAWVAFNAKSNIETVRLSEGLHVFSNSAMHDEQSEKKQRAYQLFGDITPTLESISKDSLSWVSPLAQALGDHQAGNSTGDPKDAICVHADISGTVSSSIVVYSKAERTFRTFFCPGPPCQNAFTQFSVFYVP